MFTLLPSRLLPEQLFNILSTASDFTSINVNLSSISMFPIEFLSAFELSVKKSTRDLGFTLSKWPMLKNNLETLPLLLLLRLLL